MGKGLLTQLTGRVRHVSLGGCQYHLDTATTLMTPVVSTSRTGVDTNGDRARRPDQLWSGTGLHGTDPLDLGAILQTSVPSIGLEASESPEEAGGLGIAVGDRVVLLFSDDQKRISVRLTDEGNDLEKGRLSVSTPLGVAIIGPEEGDEVELSFENGRQRKVLVERSVRAQFQVS
jgi:Transcription elongation factor, GreA/GreB, C-term